MKLIFPAFPVQHNILEAKFIWELRNAVFFRREPTDRQTIFPEK